MKNYLIVAILCLIFCLTWCSTPKDQSTDVVLLDAGPDTFSIKDSGTDTFDSGLLPIEASVSDGGFDYRQAVNDPIDYNGGVVLTSPINVYLIWYGDLWAHRATVPVIEDLISNFGASDYYKINAAYYQLPQNIDGGKTDLDASSQKTFVSNHVLLSNQVFIGYTHGQDLIYTDINVIISDVLLANQLPYDTNGVYFVLTDKTVNESYGFSQFCFNFCGWHGHAYINGFDIKYSFVGDTERCPSNCSAKPKYFGSGHFISPNNDWSADGMSTIIIHELSETITDPQPDRPAWVDIFGAENADKCTWIFGTPYITNNNSVANVKIGSRDFLIQENWVLDSNNGHCGLMP